MIPSRKASDYVFDGTDVKKRIVNLSMYCSHFSTKKPNGQQCPNGFNSVVYPTILTWARQPILARVIRVVQYVANHALQDQNSFLS